jgi:hypothetical protein
VSIGPQQFCKKHIRKTPSRKARREFFIGMGADDHFPEGNSWLQSATIWEEFATIRRQRTREYAADAARTRKRAAWQPLPQVGLGEFSNQQAPVCVTGC